MGRLFKKAGWYGPFLNYIDRLGKGLCQKSVKIVKLKRFKKFEFNYSLYRQNTYIVGITLSKNDSYIMF